MSQAKDTLLRLFALLRLIPTEPQRIATPTLLEKLRDRGFSVTLRSIQRDLSRLSIPFSLQCDDSKTPFRWSFTREAPLKLEDMDDREVDSAITKLQKAQQQLSTTEDYAFDINDVLKSVYGQFDKYFEHLKYAARRIEDIRSRKLDPHAEMARMSETILRAINNGFTLAAILVDLITTPLFKVKEVNGNVVKDKNDVPVMATDADGSMILNSTKLEEQISETKTKAQGVEPA